MLPPTKHPSRYVNFNQNILAQKLPEEGTQQHEEEVKDDEAVESLAHHRLPALKHRPHMTHMALARAHSNICWEFKLLETY